MPLQDWMADYLGARRASGLADRVAATLRVAVDPSDPSRETGATLSWMTGPDLLDAIDTALRLDEQLHVEVEVIGAEPIVVAGYASPGLVPELQWPDTSSRARAVERLQQLLLDGGSAFDVHW